MASVSSSETSFQYAAPFYKNTLRTSGFSVKIQYKYNAINNNRTYRNRTVNVLQSNPIVDIAVKNLCKLFKLVYKCFQTQFL